VLDEPEYNWGIEAALDIVGGKWKPLIIYELKDGTLRFSQIQDRVRPRITQRMLTKQLRQLEEDGLISRHVYPQVPPKVEYALTEKGSSIIPILDLLCEWGERNLSDRIRYRCDEAEDQFLRSLDR
jgi:DNA-binding HxlR family transcriptional regulator